MIDKNTYPAASTFFLTCQTMALPKIRQHIPRHHYLSLPCHLSVRQPALYYLLFLHLLHYPLQSFIYNPPLRRGQPPYPG